MKATPVDSQLIRNALAAQIKLWDTHRAIEHAAGTDHLDALDEFVAEVAIGIDGPEDIGPGSIESVQTFIQQSFE